MIWPEGTRDSQMKHAVAHVRHCETAVSLCKRRRCAIQAGGNVGLWPISMARSFEHVITFEPELVSRACLSANVMMFANIEVRKEALGREAGASGIDRKSLGSHRISSDADLPQCTILPIDVFGRDDVDLIQLDIEGYELEALKGAQKTIEISHPVIQVEMRGFSQRYGGSDEEIILYLTSLGYRTYGAAGPDTIFTHA